MPALITHDLFGQDAYDRHYKIIGGTRDEAQAFMLGNQGPDVLFYSRIDPRLKEHNRLGNIMHNEKPSELITGFKNSLSFLDETELPIGRAYALGFVCHYTLDSTVHPFIYHHEYALCDAGEPGLSRKDGTEVHGAIESELDELMLFTRRGETVATFQPWREILKGNEFILQVISKMYAYVALSVYGHMVPPALFARSTHDFRHMQHLFYSASGIKRVLLGHVEQIFRPYSFYLSMSHRPIQRTESCFDNRKKEAWENPFTGAVSTESFQDLLEVALRKIDRNIELFDQPSFTLKDARKLTKDLNFAGRPVVATLISVEDSKQQSAKASTSSETS